MRVAVAGSHSTGKSTLIAAFVARRPEYVHEAEAYEALAADIDIVSDGPTPEGMAALLEYTIAALSSHPPGACVVFERSPVDYLAYAAASRRLWTPSVADDFLAKYRPVVQAAIRDLDLIAFVPVVRGGPVLGRPGEDDRFRRRVDEHLRRALMDDDLDLFEGDTPIVVELPQVPEQQLAELLRRTAKKGEWNRRS
jgi:hypothetical protein